MTKCKMRVQKAGGINWTWFKVQNGKLVAVFRLHYGEEPLSAFRKLQMKMGMVNVENINVPMATWREPCDLVANHTDKTNGYSLPDVIEAFGWLNDMFSDVADDFERDICSKGGVDVMSHLEYHGVAICRI